MYVIIDIGSNTVRMVVFRADDGMVIPLMNNKVSCGLAGYVEDGKMNSEGVEILIETLNTFDMAISGLESPVVYPFATASLRSLSNRDAILRKVKKETGFDIDVISGEDEARYDYYGIMKRMKGDIGVLSDIGGGSTEIAIFTSEDVIFTTTMPIGSLSSFRDHVSGIVPTADEMKKIRHEALKGLRSLDVPKCDTDEICAIGGSARAACLLANKVLHRPRGCDTLEADELDEMFRIYRDEPLGFCHKILKTKPDRIHTLIPGMCVQRAVMEQLQCDRIRVSNSGVREGYLLSKLEGSYE